MYHPLCLTIFHIGVLLLIRKNCDQYYREKEKYSNTPNSDQLISRLKKTCISLLYKVHQNYITCLLLVD